MSVAESATGGLLGGRITAVPSASDYFRGGFITYSDQMKIQLLGVPAELIAEHTAVSEPVAKAMAEGARARTGSDYALSITGYAGPDGAQVGLVFIGLGVARWFGSSARAMAGRSRTRSRVFHQRRARHAAAQAARHRTVSPPCRSKFFKRRLAAS